MIEYIFVFPVLWESIVQAREHYLRLVYYDKAYAKSRQYGKPLLVIGKPKGRHPCIPEGHYVITNFGCLDISKVKNGSLILGSDGKFHKVIRTYKRKYNGEIIEITPFLANMPIRLTPDHPVLVGTKKLKHRYKWKGKKTIGRYRDRIYETKKYWKQAKDINKNEYILIPKIEITDEIDFDKDLARLCGYYVSEGSIGFLNKRPNAVRLHFGKHEHNLINDVKNICRKLFGKDPKIYDGKWKYDVVIHSAKFAEFLLENFGHGAKNKHLPQWVLKIGKDKLYEFINGLWLGDGSLVSLYRKGKHQDYFSYSTASKTLAIQVWIILVSIDIVPNINVKNNKNSTFGGGELYKLDVRGVYAKRLAKILNISIKHDGLLDNVFGKIIDGYIWLPIRKIEKKHFSGYVYNLQTTSNDYVCFPFTVHNCGDVMLDINPSGECPNEVKGDVTNMYMFGDKEFGAAYVGHVLEHLKLEDIPKAINELVRVADYVVILYPAKGGIMCIYHPDHKIDSLKYLWSINPDGVIEIEG